MDKSSDPYEVTYKVVHNNGSPESLQALINAKNVFATQLPKMPKEYIVRLVLDRNHRTMVLQSNNKVIAAICYRPFPTQRFAEIVFCAVMSAEQGKGYGRSLMCHLKEHVKSEGIDYLLTYADNYAIKYFSKQGFSRILTMATERWKGWIKDYDGATLMECGVVKEVNHTKLGEMVREQRRLLAERIRLISHSHRIYPPIQEFPVTDLSQITSHGDSINERLQHYPPPSQESDEMLLLTAQLNLILRGLFSCRDSWPFRKPVDKTVVLDYYNVIPSPMDLATMETKIHAGAYRNLADFEHDVLLIVNNCKVYNGPSTSYYRHAEETWSEYLRLVGVFFGQSEENEAQHLEIEL